MDIYAQNIMDHYRTPRNQGVIDGADVTHGEANYACGDKLKVGLKIDDSKIVDFKFTGGGCAISQAAVSILGEDIKNKPSEYILKLDFHDVKKLLGVSVSERRVKCALLGLLTIQNAILKKSNQPLKKWVDYIEE